LPEKTLQGVNRDSGATPATPYPKIS